MLPGLGQQAQERAQLALPHVTEFLPVEPLDLAVERRQEIEPLVGDAGHHYPPVLPPAPGSHHQTRLLQTIEATCPVSRERACEVTNLETAAMWVIKALVINDPNSKVDG